MATLTSADVTLTLSIANLYPSPQTIQGFAVDDAFANDPVVQAEVMMGVDAQMSAGKVFNPYPMTIHIMPTSSSLIVFETWRDQQNSSIDVFQAEGSILMPSINRVFNLKNGYLTSAPPFPAVKKVLQPMVFEVTWNLITSAPTA